MTFSSLALKNMRRNFKNYFLYVFSVTVAITFYYIFCAIKYNSKVMFASDTYLKFQIIMNMSSIVLIIFSAVFIWYCNAFFTKKRKKEVAMYTLLGVPKKRVSRMLFMENIVVLFISLTTGILVGILFSKLFMMLVLKLMEIKVNVGFSVPIKAVYDTTIVFTVLFLIASIHSAVLIYRFQIIELFSASRKVENEPRTHFLLSIASLICLGSGYYLSQNLLNQYIFFYALATLLLVIIGTFGLFSTVIVTFTKYLKKWDHFYYKGDHLIAISNIAYRINTHAKTLALITIMSATTLTAFGICYAFYFDYEQATHHRYPHAYLYELSSQNNASEIESKFMEAIEASDHKLNYHYPIEVSLLKVRIVDNKGSDDPLYLPSEWDAYFINEKTANTYLKSHNASEISVSQNQIIAMDPYASRGWVNYKDLELQFEFEDEANEMNVVDVLPYYLTTQSEDPVFILNNNDYDDLKTAPKKNFYAFDIDNPIRANDLNSKLWQIAYQYEELKMSSFYEAFTNLSEMKGLMLFSGIFMGLVFLILTGSILYFKMINEAEEDQDKYTIMRKIGYDHALIKSVIFKQMGVMFSLPILLGILHSLFALHTFETLMTSSFLTPILISIGMYVSIYMCFYWLTVQYYYRISISGN